MNWKNINLPQKEQFPWDTSQEDGCVDYYATTIGKWRVWFENKAIVFAEGIIYSLKDGKKKWARLSHSQCQIVKKMTRDTQNLLINVYDHKIRGV